MDNAVGTSFVLMLSTESSVLRIPAVDGNRSAESHHASPVTTSNLLAGAFDQSDWTFRFQPQNSNKFILPAPSDTTLGPLKKLISSPAELKVFQLQWQTAAAPKPADQQRWYFLMTNAAWMVGIRFVDAANDIDVVVIFDRANPNDAADPLAAAQRSFRAAGVAEEDMPAFVRVEDFSLQYPGLYSEGFDLEVSPSVLSELVEAGFARVATVAQQGSKPGSTDVDMSALGGNDGAGDAFVRHALAAVIAWYSEPFKLGPMYELCATQLRAPGSTDAGEPIIRGIAEPFSASAGSGGPATAGWLNLLQNYQKFRKTAVSKQGYVVVKVPDGAGKDVERVFALVNEEPGRTRVLENLNKPAGRPDLGEGVASGTLALEPLSKLFKYVA